MRATSPAASTYRCWGCGSAWASCPGTHALTLYRLSGYRSSVAASLLQRAGVTGVTELVGGMAAWRASKLAVEHP